MFKNIRKEYFIIYYCSTIIYIIIGILFHLIDRSQKHLSYDYDMWSSIKLGLFIYVLVLFTTMAIIGIVNSVERLSKRR